MEVLKYIATAITIIIAIYAVTKDYKLKTTNRLSKHGILLIVLIIISSLTYLLIDLYSNAEQKKQQSDLMSDVKLLTKKNDGLNIKISKLIEDNYTLSREVAKNSLGDGYAIFGVLGQKKQGKYYCQLKSKSEYPIYDIHLLVTDFDKAINCKSKFVGDNFLFDDECFFKNTSTFRLGTLAPGMRTFVDYNFNSSSKYKNIEIKFVSRSTNILQQSVFELKQGICEQSYRIYEIENNFKLIEENNELNLPDKYWEDNFFPVQNRKLGNVSD